MSISKLEVIPNGVRMTFDTGEVVELPNDSTALFKAHQDNYQEIRPSVEECAKSQTEKLSKVDVKSESRSINTADGKTHVLVDYVVNRK